MKLNRVEKTIKHLKNISYASSTLYHPWYHHFRFRHEAPIFWFAIALSWPLALYCLWRRQLFCCVIFSLGAGSTVREKGKTRGQTGKISANEASPAVAWGGGKGGRVPLGYLRWPFLFPFSPSAEPGPRLRHLLFFNAARKMKKCGNWLLVSAWNWVRVFGEKTSILAKFVQFATYLYGCFYLLGVLCIQGQNWAARTFPS